MPHRSIKFIKSAFLAGVLVGVGIFSFALLGYAQNQAPTGSLGLTPEVEQAIGLGAGDIRVTVAKIIRAALGLLGIVALALILYGGYLWMTAGGNEERIASAKQVLINAVIGLAIILSAYSIVSFVISRLLEATKGLPAHCSNGLFEADTEEELDCGKECPACGAGGGGVLGSLFYISSLPGAGQLCARNPHPAVVFNRPPDLATLKKNAVIEEVKNSVSVAGTWTAGSDPTIAIFAPAGSCAPAPGNDCLAPSTTYRFKIPNSSGVKTADGRLALNCVARPCGPVEFTTGEAVDAMAPTITIEYPGPGSVLQAGTPIPARMSFSDDNGLQMAALYQSAGAAYRATGKFTVQSYLVGPTTNWSYSLASADFDSDGKTDIIVAGQSTSTLAYFKGKGDGTFAPAERLATGGVPAYFLRASDFNNDGKADLVFSYSFGSPFLAILLGNGDGTFKAPISYQVTSGITYLLAADLNADGNADLVATRYYRGQMLSIILGKGDGTFGKEITYPLGQTPLQIAAGDINGDQKIDLAVTDQAASAVHLLFGKGDGTFENPRTREVRLPDASKSNPTAAAIADVNGDSRSDLILTHWLAGAGDSASVQLGLGGGNLTPPEFYGTGLDPNGVIVKDFTGDGKLDLAVSLYNHSNQAGVNILAGQGDGVFQAAQFYLVGPETQFDFTSADFNGDGLPDLASTYINSKAPGTSNLGVWLAEKVKVGTAQLIGSQTFQGCVKSGTVDLTWATGGLAPGLYTLEGKALDVSAHEGSDTKLVLLRPAHCFDNKLDADRGEIEAGPPACGGECGACAGGGCQSNDQCASGWCEIPQGKSRGVCVDRMRITGVSPLQGAVGDFVTISGYYFGDNPGKVYFSKTPNPVANNPADWVEGKIVNCGPGFDNWTAWQIIVEVPAGAVVGPVKIATAPVKGADGVVRTLVDTTDDVTTKLALAQWGPRLNDFVVSAGSPGPGICGLQPAAGVGGDIITVRGKNFGLLDSGDDAVWFGASKTRVDPGDWFDTAVMPVVPDLEPGVVAVKVVNNGRESNGVRFTVESGVAAKRPVVLSVTPDHGPEGEYITIRGKNFGNLLGSVWFKNNPNAQAIIGDFNFPPVCKNSLWRDDQIIVKFPRGQGEVGQNYLVQVNTADNHTSPIQPSMVYTVEAGTPAPGLCKIDPVSGPVPFAFGLTMKLAGEYFGNNPEVYYWRPGASSTALTGRVKGAVVKAEATVIEATPPPTTASGPVAVYRPGDRKMSNPAAFTVLDCVKNNNTCAEPALRCCASGAEVGICKPKAELCAGETRSAGYVWRFATRDIPEIPRVVERCDADTNLGKNLPSPSPSTIWKRPLIATSTDDQWNVCRTALATVEFSVPLDQGSVNANTIRLYQCESVEAGLCRFPTQVELNPTSFTLLPALALPNQPRRDYLGLQPKAVPPWRDNAWYQVVLGQALRAASADATPLAPNRPCDTKEITNTAYCFAWQTNARDCKLKAVVVTPTSYWTQVLERPVSYQVSTSTRQPVDYWGQGLSDQHCVMMDVSGFNWQWATEDADYSKIFGPNSARRANVTAEANTVDINLPNDAVLIAATATTNTPDGPVKKTGESPLTIDLSNPSVADFWPNCLEACTNAEVAVKFNVTMSLRNLPGAPERGTVQLLKCLNENCLSTQTVLQLDDVVLDPPSRYTVLKLANSRHGISTPLAPNSLYQVIISATSTNPLKATNLLWSAANSLNPLSFSKPYNQVFTWRFRTKKEACRLERVEVTPSEYFARTTSDRATYTAQPWSAPDACSPVGQKLNAWSINWNWAPSDPAVATIQSFSTRAPNPACTAACIRQGSDVPAEPLKPLPICPNNLPPVALAKLLPVCGNGQVEAGEDCDQPDKTKGCGLDCRFTGNADRETCGDGKVEPARGEACDPKDPGSQVGCSATCQQLGSSPEPIPQNPQASICGNGAVGSGEDCDLGITAAFNNPQSALGCSNICLHLGTRLAKAWCRAHDPRLIPQAPSPYGGFTAAQFDAACGLAYSQCGDFGRDEEEDDGCDGRGPWNNGQGGWNYCDCTPQCLKKAGDSTSDITKDNDCGVDFKTVPEGCTNQLQHQGSALQFSKPSICGDGVVGLGEDATCETKLSGRPLLFDPWALAQGVGLGVPVPNITPPEQRTTITASTKDQTPQGKTVAGAGQFIIQCGFQSDAECVAATGNPGMGVGSDSCCYLKPKLIGTFPVSSTPPNAPLANVCRNTALQAIFDQEINPATIPGNLLIARGVVDRPKISAPQVGVITHGGGTSLQGPEGIAISGNFAYVADYSGLAVAALDISDPEPRPVGFISDDSLSRSGAHLKAPIGLTAAGDYLYVASFASDGLEVLKINNTKVPGVPEHAGFLAHDPKGAQLARPRTVAVAGQYAYVIARGDGSGGTFQIIDISGGPQALRPLGWLKHDPQGQGANLNDPADLAVAGDYAYVTAFEGHAVQVIDISNKQRPRPVKTIVRDFNRGIRLLSPTGIAVAGDKLYVVARADSALVIFDLANPADPLFLSVLLDGQVAPQGGRINIPNSVAVEGQYAFIANENANGVEAVFVGDPRQPEHAAFIKGVDAKGNELKQALFMAFTPTRMYASFFASKSIAAFDISEFRKPLFTCTGEADVTTLIARAQAAVHGSWWGQWWQVVRNWFRQLFGGNATAQPISIPKKWCVGSDLGMAETILDYDADGAAVVASQVRVRLKQPLAPENMYAIILKEGIKSARGVSLGKVGAKSINWKFSTGKDICEVNSVAVAPAQWYFSRAGATTTLAAQAGTRAGGSIQSIPGFYAWEYQWGPRVNPYVTLETTTSSRLTLTAQNRNGEIDVRATAVITANYYTAARGAVATGKSHVIVFLCENPWPPKDLFLLDQQNKRLGPFRVFPYEDQHGNNDDFDISANTFTSRPIPPSAVVADGYFNFRTYYCADAGAGGSKADDLPYLRPTVQTSPAALAVSKGACELTGKACIQDQDCGQQAGRDLRCFQTRPLKRFFFTNGQNNDVIGIQIFENRQHLTPLEWYSADKARGGRGFVGDVQRLTVDDYAAVRDANNVYVDALNYTSSTDQFNNVIGNLYSTIYLFSLNAEARPETRAVFDKLFTNLRFNSNLTNYGYCGARLDLPGDATACATDFDCRGGEVCSVQIDKLKRDYQRLRRLQEIQARIAEYSAANQGASPELREGTYLSGQAISTWPQWSVLETAVGKGLPTDPINRLGAAGTCASSTNIFCVTSSTCPIQKNSNPPAPERCVLHDPLTGWSAENRRFSFACASPSLAFRYIHATSTGYRVRARWEELGLPLKEPNFTNFVSDFVSTTRFRLFEPAGICERDQEILTLQRGSCGDGQVNLNQGEECDPPGITRYGACIKNFIKVDVCSRPGELAPGEPGCRWMASSTPGEPGFITCTELGRCGNGAVEYGELCDDGILNGRYNHCDAPGRPDDKNTPANESLGCRSFGSAGACGDGKPQPQELCEIKSGNRQGWCVEGLNAGAACNRVKSESPVCNEDQATNTKSAAGRCLYLSETNNRRYALRREDSCNFDCQSYGPYCGDGVVQSEFGEECEVTESCALSGKTGTRACKDCRTADNAPAAWWRFDDYLEEGNTQTFADAAGTHPGVCTLPDTCPAFSPAPEARAGNSFFFDGVDDVITVKHRNDLMPTTTLSVEAWVKPRSFNTQWARVLDKSWFGEKPGGYDLQTWRNTGRISFAVFGDFVGNGWTNYWLVNSSTSLPLNAWTHIVGTYSYVVQDDQTVQTIKLYINGEEETLHQYPDRVLLNGGPQSSNVLVNTPPALLPNTEPLALGRGGGGRYFWDGQIDEVKIYRRVLTAAEVKERYRTARPCVVAATSPLALAAPGTCGDGRVDPGEACDKGQANGVRCTPSYGRSCSFCEANCKSITDIQPEEFCGNGYVEKIGRDKQGRDVWEFCDTDPNTSAIYAAATTTETGASLAYDNQGRARGYQAYACSDPAIQQNYTLKKGTKQCLNKCSIILVAETKATSCVTCGLTSAPRGVKVAGTVVNALDPKSPTPLLMEKSQQFLDLFLATTPDRQRLVGSNYVVRIPEQDGNVGVSYRIQSGRDYLLVKPDGDAADPNADKDYAPITNHELCSFGPPPNYTLMISEDAAHARSLPVRLDATPAPVPAYDLFLSPIVPASGLIDPKTNLPLDNPRAAQYDNSAAGAPNNTARPGDIRIVLHWQGEGELVGGFAIPAGGGQPATLEGADLLVKGTGLFYYDEPNAAFRGGVADWATMTGVWHHGVADTAAQSHLEAFTVDTYASSLSAFMVAPYYYFYVRPDANKGISLWKGKAVTVEVYQPEADTDYRHFAKPTPSYTYKLDLAAPSGNRDARYWHVFTVKRFDEEPDINKRVAPALLIDPQIGKGTPQPQGRIVSDLILMR